MSTVLAAPAGVDRSPLSAEFYRQHWGEMPAPKFSTPRDFTVPTLGTRQGKFATVWLGQPYMPFQQYIADVAGELRRTDAGLWVPRYRLVVLLAQRQCGKSHMAMARNGERCFSKSGWRSWYTAQTGQDARDQFLKFYDEQLARNGAAEKAPLYDVVKIRRSNGQEAMTFPNGSTIRPRPPTEEKLHGKQADGDDIDEAWAFSLEEGKALMQAGAPTKLTRPWSQTWIMSAGGTAESTWLADLVARLRLGEDPDVCFIEFGIPDDADPEDLEVIAAYHPAYGHTVTMDALKAMRTDFGADAAGWARAAGNRWTEVIGGAIGPDLWKALTSNVPDVPDGVPVGYGAARSADGREVAIVAAAEIEPGRYVAEVLDVLSSAYLAADHINAWAVDGPIAVAKNGPSGGIAEALVKLKPKQLITMSVQEEAAATSTILDTMEARAIQFKPRPELDAAVGVAATRTIGDGGKTWSRSSAAASIATLDAATAALWALQHRRKPVGRPRIVTAD